VNAPFSGTFAAMLALSHPLLFVLVALAGWNRSIQEGHSR